MRKCFEWSLKHDLVSTGISSDVLTAAWTDEESEGKAISVHSHCVLSLNWHLSFSRYVSKARVRSQVRTCPSEVESINQHSLVHIRQFIYSTKKNLYINMVLWKRLVSNFSNKIHTFISIQGWIQQSFLLFYKKHEKKHIYTLQYIANKSALDIGRQIK